ncbi:GTP pyrophosphokinase [Pseudomonas viridiflava]|uniref:GTP pyrophosphokinase n=1 Tax=Pseudomonas viridiflava TaxID=33069 RepID=UPI000F04BFB0|nr:hypothetical protein [Pseudomonas viridiflava]
MDQDHILKVFDECKDVYDAYAKTVTGLLERLLDAKNISYHSISYRCKTAKSLIKKIEKKQHYDSLDDITDLAGVRVITHYADDVDVVASLVEREFRIDRDNSIDKRAALDPEKFGYLSLHYIVSLKRDRERLQEYSAFKGKKLEIQVRSILQHTWAEIEHDIGYKSETEVPRVIRRKFSRLAGLLELADQEFVSIRSDLSKYIGSITDAVKKHPDKVLIDAVTFENFCLEDDFSKKMDQIIADLCFFDFYKRPQNTAIQLNSLMFHGITTIERLKEALIENEAGIMRRARDVAENRDSNHRSIVSPGISVFYLSQVLAANTKDLARIEKFLKSRYGRNSEKSDEAFRDYLMQFSADDV